MMSRWKRLLCSLLSVAMAGMLYAGVVRGPAVLVHPFSVAGLNMYLEFTGFVFYVSLPGWVIASPIVLLVKDYSGWRAWVCLAAGSCIGAILASVPRIFANMNESAVNAPGASEGGTFLFAVSISTLTTLIYLALVHWSQPSASEAANQEARGTRL
jgi:hypothetical protein